jgi:ADP-ribose pyrophosphatase YjhB (NUDIX family)
LTIQGRDIRVRVAGILKKNDKLLLVAHKKNNNVYWLLPGGGVDFGESLTEALKREFLEELNIKIEVKDLLLISETIFPSGERQILNICFCCEYIEGEFILGNEQRLHDFGFFTEDEIKDITILPPLNSELVDIMAGNRNARYIGKIWGDI